MINLAWIENLSLLNEENIRSEKAPHRHLFCDFTTPSRSEWISAMHLKSFMMLSLSQDLLFSGRRVKEVLREATETTS